MQPARRTETRGHAEEAGEAGAPVDPLHAVSNKLAAIATQATDL